MSKIGKINITIPEKVKVAIAGNILNIEGPLGKKSLNIDLELFNLDIKDGKEISIKPKKIDQNTKNIIKEIGKLDFPSISTILNAKFSQSEQLTYICDICNNFSGKNLRALAAHKRGCIKTF